MPRQNAKAISDLNAHTKPYDPIHSCEPTCRFMCAPMQDWTCMHTYMCMQPRSRDLAPRRRRPPPQLRHQICITRTYIYIYMYICVWSPPARHADPFKTLSEALRNLLFCWSEFGSFSDAAFVSNGKTGKAKDPRIQNPKKSKTVHIYGIFQKSLDFVIFGFWDFWICCSVALWVSGHQEVHFRVSWGGGVSMCVYIYLLYTYYRPNQQ